VIWIPVDLAFRKALDKGNCDNIQQYVAEEYGEYDTDRRYPEMAALRTNSCNNRDALYKDLFRITGVFFTGGDQ